MTDLYTTPVFSNKYIDLSSQLIGQNQLLDMNPNFNETNFQDLDQPEDIPEEVYSNDLTDEYYDDLTDGGDNSDELTAEEEAEKERMYQEYKKRYEEE